MRDYKTCRCPICGRKDADTNHARNSYIRVGIGKDEHGKINGAKSKQHSRKLRRIRENQEFVQSVWEGDVV